MDNTSLATQTVALVSSYFCTLADKRDFYRKLAEHFNKDELQNLCFDLNVEYENLSGDTRQAKARELITYCIRHEQMPALHMRCFQLRPTVFSRPQTTDYPHVKQSEQKLAATTYQMLQREVLTDDYVSQTLDRLADRPTAQGRQQTLKLLLTEFFEDNPDFAASLQKALQADNAAGDFINQNITLTDNASIHGNVIGQIKNKL
ncbi:MAG: hypothetical protein KDE48_19160 [Anaerolineales bacterium]|nr:hypothetical protein [Anaerolineales bacterium]